MDQQTFSGPHLQAAVICEKVLIERDSAVSLIRIFDRINIPSSSSDAAAVDVLITIFTSFKSGFFRGKASIKITPITPNKQELPTFSFPVLFEGDDERGIYVEARITMRFPEEGLYWFDVSVLDTLATRIPLRVVHEQRLAIHPGV